MSTTDFTEPHSSFSEGPTQKNEVGALSDSANKQPNFKKNELKENKPPDQDNNSRVAIVPSLELTIEGVIRRLTESYKLLYPLHYGVPCPYLSQFKNPQLREAIELAWPALATAGGSPEGWAKNEFERLRFQKVVHMPKPRFLANEASVSNYLQKMGMQRWLQTNEIPIQELINCYQAKKEQYCPGELTDYANHPKTLLDFMKGAFIGKRHNMSVDDFVQAQIEGLPNGQFPGPRQLATSEAEERAFRYAARETMAKIDKARREADAANKKRLKLTDDWEYHRRKGRVERNEADLSDFDYLSRRYLNETGKRADWVEEARKHFYKSE